MKDEAGTLRSLLTSGPTFACLSCVNLLHWDLTASHSCIAALAPESVVSARTLCVCVCVCVVCTTRCGNLETRPIKTSVTFVRHARNFQRRTTFYFTAGLASSRLVFAIVILPEYGTLLLLLTVVPYFWKAIYRGVQIKMSQLVQ